MKRTPAIILLMIVLIAAWLRLYRLAEVPPGVNRDEASIGYTAYSLLKTGRDEYGRFLPLSFQSFGDWKLPLYIYTTIPFVRVLGLNELAVRLPSAIAGTLTVLVTFFLVFQLFRNSLITLRLRPSTELGRMSSGQAYRLSLIASFLLAISPWHLHLSRVESESNLAVMFISFATILFFKGLRTPKNPWLFPLSLTFFALTYWTYHGNHIFTTLFLIGLIFLYKKEIFRIQTWRTSIVIFFVLTGLILFLTLHQADQTKLSGIGIFGDPAVVHTKIELPRNEHPNSNGLLARLTHNRVTYAITTIAQNYLKSYSPEFLFIKGGGNRAHNIENFGNMYIVEAPFLLLGIVFLISNITKKPYQLLLAWLLISPIASSITKDAPHSNRMFAIFPALPIITALGISWLIRQGGRLSRYWVLVLALFYTVNIAAYLERYYMHFPRNEAQYWGYGYQKLTSLLYSQELNHNQAVISHPEYSPYIFLLFYSGYDPARYQREAIRYTPTADAFYHVKEFGRFSFRPIKWNNDLVAGKVVVDLYDETPAEIRNNPSLTKIIYLPTRQPFLTVVSPVK